jgi:hypothetical protein
MCLSAAQHGADALYTATPGNVSNTSLYVYTRNQNGQLTDEMFSIQMLFYSSHKISALEALVSGNDSLS